MPKIINAQNKMVLLAHNFGDFGLYSVAPTSDKNTAGQNSSLPVTESEKEQEEEAEIQNSVGGHISSGLTTPY